MVGAHLVGACDFGMKTAESYARPTEKKLFGEIGR